MEINFASHSWGWDTFGMGSHIYELSVALVLVLTVPFLLHFTFFRTSRQESLPSILLLGPSESGKTALLTLLKLGRSSKTHASQTSNTVELVLPNNIITGSDKYRSANDPLHNVNRKILLIDTPGHGKLRHLALQDITEKKSLKGIIYVVDAARLKPDYDYLRQTAEYLYEVLLFLKRKGEESNYKSEIPVLIASNKMDLFTALPASYVQKNLELEMTKIRASKSNCLLNSDTNASEGFEDVKDEWLGEKGSDEFHFSQMKESINVPMEIWSGHVLGDEPQVEKWWKWIAGHL